MEFFRIAHSAEIGHVDTIGGEAGGEELRAIDGREVDSLPSLPAELRGDLGADFVAALSDAGSDGRVQIGRVCPELRVHLIGGLARDLGGCPTPSGVDGGYSAVAVIDQQDRDAIRGFDGDYGAWSVFDERIAFGEYAVSAARGHARGGVNLF